MNRSSGFVPIRFQAAGRILITLGSSAAAAYLISRLTGWFFVGWEIGMLGLMLILIGLYLVYIVTKE